MVHEANERGVRVLALTDHDTLSGIQEARDAAAAVGIELIPGVELSARDDDHDVHLLGYYVDTADTKLTTVLARLAAQRVARIERIVARLHELGIPVELERVLALAGGGSVGRPHVARALIERGDAESVNDAFARLLAIGRPAYVPRDSLSPEDAIALIRDANAVPVLAHPYTAGDVEAVLARLVPAGLLGMEVFYGEYTPDQRANLREIAERWNLIPTGGSDYHGPSFKPGRDLGTVAIPEETPGRLFEAHKRLAARS